MKHCYDVSNVAKKSNSCLHAEHKYGPVPLLPLCFCSLALCICMWCSADRIEWALVQLLLFDAQLTHPGQQLRGRDEQTSTQQEGKHIGFLS